MRVLLISHTCQSNTEGQPKAEHLARLPDVEMCVLSPHRWLHYGKWRRPAIPHGASFRYEVGRVMWPWAGPAQFYLHWYPHLARLLKAFSPDIIDVWEEPWGLVSAHACWLRNRLLPNAKIVAETEQNINKVLPPPFEQFRSYTLRHADFAVGRSDEAVALLRTKGYKGPAEVVPNGVDAQLFQPVDREASRRTLGLSGFVVGYVGRLVEEKGLMDMVELLRLCSEDVHLLFVGDGPLRQPLEQHAQALGKSRQVRFLPNRPASELPQVINALDVLVLMSRTTESWKEQFGRVIIEAQACQIPVIGSTSGAIPEIIGAAGLVVPERDPAALATAIRTLQKNPHSRTELGRVGRQVVEEKYTWERVAQQMHEIYCKTLSR